MRPFNRAELMSPDIMREGDQINFFLVRLLNPDGSPVDVSSSEVKWSMANDRGRVIADKQAETTADEGIIKLMFTSEDQTGFGKFNIQIEETRNGASTYYPSDNNLEVYIPKNINNLDHTPASFYTIKDFENKYVSAEPFEELTEEKQAEINILNRELQADIKGKLLKGYYNSVNGSYDVGTNWFHYYVKTNGITEFILEHPKSIIVRVVQFDSNKQRITSKTTGNGMFSLLSNCAYFALNVKLDDAYPPGSDLTPFDDKEDMLSIVIRHENGVAQKAEEAFDKVDSNLMNVPIGIEGTETWQTLTSTVKNGYYNRSNGEFRTGVNWKHIFIETLDTRTYRIENTEPGTVRIVQFKNGDYISSDEVGIGNDFDILDRTTHFAINIPLTNADPSSGSLTQFTTDSNFVLKGFVPEYEQRTLLSQFKELKRHVESGTSINKRISILSIGNSFSLDASKWLFDISRSAGIDLVVGNLYRGGEDLQGHWDQVQSNAASYIYYKWSPEQGSQTFNDVTLDSIVSGHKWDIIIMQQVSGLSGQYSTFQPYLNDLISHVKGLSSNPELEIGLHMTWAYASDSTHPDFPNYNSDQLEMFQAITQAYQEAIEETDIDILIPSGTSIQNARTNDYLMAVGDELTRDGHHMDYGIGRYIAGLTYFSVLVAGKNNKNILSDVTFYPPGGSKSLAYLSKLAVNNAILRPFKVTDF